MVQVATVYYYCHILSSVNIVKINLKNPGAGTELQTQGRGGWVMMKSNTTLYHDTILRGHLTNLPLQVSIMQFLGVFF